jgi:hypothetical protein
LQVEKVEGVEEEEEGERTEGKEIISLILRFRLPISTR